MLRTRIMGVPGWTESWCSTALTAAEDAVERYDDGKKMRLSARLLAESVVVEVDDGLLVATYTVRRRAIVIYDATPGVQPNPKEE